MPRLRAVQALVVVALAGCQAVPGALSCPDNRLHTGRAIEIYPGQTPVGDTATWCSSESGKPDGYYVARSADAVVARGAFSKGKPNGSWSFFYPDGSPSATCSFQDGKLDGKFSTWFRSGAIESVSNYRAGLRHGISEAWYEDGQKALVKSFRNGTPDGEWRAWRRNGLLVASGHSDAATGRSIETIFAPDGHRAAEYRKLRGRRHGPFRTWLPDGSLSRTGRYENGVEVEASGAGTTHTEQGTSPGAPAR